MINMKKYILYISLVLALLTASYFIGRVSTLKERSVLVDNIHAARDTIKTYSVRIGDLELNVSEKEAIILTKEDAIKAGLIEKEYFRKLYLKEIETTTMLNGVIKILRDSLDLPPETIIVTIKDTSGLAQYYMKIPFQNIKVNEKYLVLNAGVRDNRKAWFELSVPVSGTMSVGYKKDGFLKTKPVGIFTTENPYLKINNMDILIVKDKDKWYRKWWVHSLAGGGIVATLWYLTTN